MKKNAHIFVKTIQNIDGDMDQRALELETKGRFAQRNGKFFVMYEETEMTGFEDTTTTIKISDDAVIVTRNGKYNSKMEFRLGEERLCNYPTVMGTIPVSVNPIAMQSSLDENGGSVYIDYILDMDQMGKLRNRLNLTVGLDKTHGAETAAEQKGN